MRLRNSRGIRISSIALLCSSDGVLNLGAVALHRNIVFYGGLAEAFSDTAIARASKAPATSEFHTTAPSSLGNVLVLVLSDVDVGDSDLITLLQITICNDMQLGSAAAERRASGWLARVRNLCRW